MLLDFDYFFKDLRGKDLPGSKACEFLAEMLASKTDQIPPTKAIDWAITLYKTRKIDIDKTDTELLLKFIEQSNKNPNINCTNLVAVPLMNTINDALLLEKNSEKKQKGETTNE